MSKGTEYELEVVNLVQQLLFQEELAIHADQAKIQHKPSYYSRDRMKDITFDLSIEVCRKGVQTPFWIWIWECKNYSHTVPVDDVEEFHAKLNQVGANRTKGTMITPVGFDSSALEFAKSKGIGLCRWISPNSPVFIMDSEILVGTEEDIIRGLTVSSTSGFPFCGFFYGMTTTGVFTTDRSKLIIFEFSNTY